MKNSQNSPAQNSIADELVQIGLVDLVVLFFEITRIQSFDNRFLGTNKLSKSLALKATNSLKTSLIATSRPTAKLSDQGTPIMKAIGVKA